MFLGHSIDPGDLDAGSISCCWRSAKTKREQPLPQCREALKTQGELRKCGSRQKKTTSADLTPPASTAAGRNESKAKHRGNRSLLTNANPFPAFPFPQNTMNPSLRLAEREGANKNKIRREIINHSIAT